MNKKIIIAILCVLVIVGAAWYFFQGNKPQIQSAPGAWSHYQSPELKVSFDYPSNWKLSKQTVSSLGISVDLQGDKETAEFTNLDKDLPTSADTFTTTETISDHKVVLYQEKGRPGVMATLPGYCPGVDIVLTSWTGARENMDKIIASVVCTK